MDNSTSVDNPVNQIASLLTGESLEKPKEEEQQQPEGESLEAVQTDQEIEPLDESQSEESQDESQEANEEGEIDTLNNLAEELDVPVADLYQLNLKMSGDDEPVTIGSLKDFYEANKNINVEREELTKREQDLATQAEELREIPTVTNELMQARAAVLSIQDQYNRTDWKGLRFSNPAEFAALQAEFRQQFDMAKANEERASTTHDAQKQERKRLQQERLFEAIPELKDEAYRKTVGENLATHAAKYGISAKEMDAIDDSRVLRLLIDASKASMAKETVKEKQVDKTPVANKPAPKRPAVGRKAALKRLTERAKASGATRKDQVNAVSALLGGS